MKSLQSLGLFSLSKSLLQCSNSTVDVATVRIRDTDTHVTEPDVLGSNLLVQASREDGATLEDAREDIGGRQTLGQIDGGHAVGLVLGLVGELTQAQVGNGGLDAVRDLGVRSEAL